MHFRYAVVALRVGVQPDMVAARVSARALQDRKRGNPVSAAQYAARTVMAAAAISPAREYSKKGKPMDNKQSSVNLLCLLARKMRDSGDTQKSAAAKLGISYPYLQALLLGQRPVAQSSKSVLAAIASYLDIPVAQAYIWSGALTVEDFFRKPTLASELDALYEKLLHSAEFGAYMPTTDQWGALDTNVKVLIAALYEKASGDLVLEPVRVSIPILRDHGADLDAESE